jgi:ATP-binding cassette subfamily B protein RaxB
LGVVLQEDELLPGTIADNVCFFDERRDLERVWRCLGMAAIDADVEAFPMQLDTFVGDMGSMLSGGQRQRILLARALYRGPRLLVLDEATSHLDALAEQRILSAVAGLGITRVVVTHRRETVAAADRVVDIRDLASGRSDGARRRRAGAGASAQVEASR